MQALVLSADPESDLRAGYAARIAAARTAHEDSSAGPRRILLAGYNGARNTGADLRTGEIVRQLRGEFAAEGLELGVVTMGSAPLPDWGRVTLERIEGYPPDAVHDLCQRYDAVVVCEGSLFTSTFSDSLAMLFTAFLGMARALGNLIGNCTATVVIAAWEGDLDHDKARRVLDGAELVDVTAG